MKFLQMARFIVVTSVLAAAAVTIGVKASAADRLGPSGGAGAGKPGPVPRSHLPARLPALDEWSGPALTGMTTARALSAAPARLPETASLATIEAATCPPSAVNWGVPVACGYVPVPLEWNDPGKGQIKIYFELYRPDRPEPAQNAILFNWGGPGSATTFGSRFFAFYFFSQNLDTHDFLLIDDRGRGLSTTIICPELQHGTAPFTQAEADCAAQLGLTASRYGTGEIAQDTDAVRAALGYDKVDYFGWSYGGADIEAYATRFGKHLRSIVLDSPVGTPALDPFVFNRARTEGDRRLVRLDCKRSPTCAADHPVPELELDLLVWAVRNHPVEGDAYDANGNLTHVRIDEEALLNWIIDNPNGNLLNTGELLAAGSALVRGDPLPLLRLAAEQNFGLEGDNGNPVVFSMGAARATGCVDFLEHWDWSAPLSERQRQFDAAVSALPHWYFAPFSKEAVTGLLYDFFGSSCLWWEKPTASSPVVPRHPRYPGIPTLVLSGDLDQRVPLEITSEVAELYPKSTFVRVAEATHVSVIWSSCAANLAPEFIRNLTLADTSCANTPDVVWPAVGRFPRLARDARPAEVDPTANNSATAEERKVATVAVAAATDAMQRAIIGFGSGVGLRGGTFTTDYGDFTTWTVTLTDSAFVEDVAVSGTVTWSPSSPAFLGQPGDASFTADLTVAGKGTKGGQLHVVGTWQARGPVGNFKVTGTLGGRPVAVLVPEA